MTSEPRPPEHVEPDRSMLMTAAEMLGREFPHNDLEAALGITEPAPLSDTPAQGEDP